MSCKTFVKSAFELTFFLIVVYVVVCLVIDPFNLIHAIRPKRYVSTEQRYARQAVARSRAFNSFILGASMTQEFKIPHFNQALHARFAHLTLPAASSYEELNMLRQLPPRRYRYLFMDLYFNAFTEDLKATYYPNYPSFLYDNPRYNDVLAYLQCNPWILRELYLAYYKNILGVDKNPRGRHGSADGYDSLESGKRWERKKVRQDIRAIWAHQHQRLAFSTANFKAILETAAPRFDRLLFYFPPVHAESLRAHFIDGPPENLQAYLRWKKEMIAMAASYPNVVLLDYQTINPYTLEDENYFDFNHFRAPIRQMILDDVVSWLDHRRLAHPDFGAVATPAYGNRLRPDLRRP